MRQLMSIAMTKTTRGEEWKRKLERDFLVAYSEHADALFRHCLIRVRDREVAKDIVQETYSRTWLYLSEGNYIEYPRAFLYRVVNNLIVDGSRKKKSASLEKMMEDDGFEIADESLTDPVDRTSVREALKHLTSLDEIYQTAIRMRFFEHMSPSEIATALVVSERIHRGIERLGRLMKPGAKSIP